MQHSCGYNAWVAGRPGAVGKIREEKEEDGTNLAEKRRSLSSNMTTSSPPPVKIGIIGCGNISGIYYDLKKSSIATSPSTTGP